MGCRDIIAVGGSLGAIDAVKRLLRELPAEFKASMFIAIHIGDHGNDLLADIFGAASKMTVTTAVDGERLQRGHAYVAPADRHLLVMGDTIRLGRGPRENMARPALDPLFRSVAASFGPRTTAVVLTGMLNDGAAGLADVRRCGGTTVVQSPLDAVAQDMPRGALGATDVDYRAPISEMAALLVELAGEEAGPPVAIPDDIRSEVDIALGRPPAADVLAKLARPVPLSCSGWGGVLSQLDRWPPIRFRGHAGHAGHAYTADALACDKEGSIGEALLVALRIMEQRRELTMRMAEDARQSGREAAAASYEERLAESDAYARILRRAIRDA